VTLSAVPTKSPARASRLRSAGLSFGTVSFGGVTRLISDEPTAKTRLSYRDTPLLLTVPNDRRRRHRCGYRDEQPHV
jgi:hypothetical protein